jgi:hypothetical protein
VSFIGSNEVSLNYATRVGMTGFEPVSLDPKIEVALYYAIMNEEHP